MKILLIEDDIIWSSHLQKQLDQLGYEDVFHVSNLNEASAYFTAHLPALIITDILLGDTTVFELFKNKSHVEIPCLFITSSESMIYYDIAKTMPNTAYLIKPFHPISLQAAIDKLIGPSVSLLDVDSAGIMVRGLYNERLNLKADQVVYVSSDRNYVNIKTPNNQFIMKAALSQVHKDLGTKMIQVHRSYIVNKASIQDVDLNKMEIDTGENRIPIGATYKTEVINFLKEKIPI